MILVGNLERKVEAQEMDVRGIILKWIKYDVQAGNRFIMERIRANDELF